MPPGPSRSPFSERGGRLRGVIDLATGRYPAFLFGAPTGSCLPVFHLHESSAAVLEPRLQYLADNGYRTVTSDAVTALVTRGVHPGPRTVVLCFDDAWTSLWTTAAPLLRRYGFSAIAFVIPARLSEVPTLRATIDESPVVRDLDRSDQPFVTWPELLALHASGVVDVQSHSWSHSMVFSSDEPIGFVGPAFGREPLLSRPLTVSSEEGGPRGPTFLGEADTGAPLYERRSRLSDGWRFFEDPIVRARCVAHVRSHGAEAFFARPTWMQELRAIHAQASPGGRFETDAERTRAITEELDRSRSELSARLGPHHVRQVCAPWGIAGDVARQSARALGFDTMFSDRLFGRRAVRKGDDPYSLMRLHERFISCLPGRNRRFFHSAA